MTTKVIIKTSFNAKSHVSVIIDNINFTYICSLSLKNENENFRNFLLGYSTEKNYLLYC